MFYRRESKNSDGTDADQDADQSAVASSDGQVQYCIASIALDMRRNEHDQTLKYLLKDRSKVRGMQKRVAAAAAAYAGSPRLKRSG